MNKIIIAVIIWVSAGIVNAGFINATFRASFPSLMSIPREARSNLSFSVGWSVIFSPAAILVTPLVTGFYQDGWTLSGEPVRR